MVSRKLKTIEEDAKAPAQERFGSAPANWVPLIDAALEIGAQRNRLLSELRKAVLAGNRELVFNIARKLVGGTE